MSPPAPKLTAATRRWEYPRGVDAKSWRVHFQSELTDRWKHFHPANSLLKKWRKNSADMYVRNQHLQIRTRYCNEHFAQLTSPSGNWATAATTTTAPPNVAACRGVWKGEGDCPPFSLGMPPLRVLELNAKRNWRQRSTALLTYSIYRLINRCNIFTEALLKIREPTSLRRSVSTLNSYSEFLPVCRHCRRVLARFVRQPINKIPLFFWFYFVMWWNSRFGN